MKRLFVFFFLIINIFILNTIQLNAEQFVLPTNIYVGDTVEIRFIFHSDVNLFADGSLGETSEIELSNEYAQFRAFSEKCFVKKANISRVGNEYTFRMEIIPWKAGILDFPIFDLGALILFSKDCIGVPPVYWIDLEPITVNSLVEKNSVLTFRPAASPLLLPGTMLILIIIGVLIFVFLCFVIFSISKLPVISLLIEKFIAFSTLKKNSRVSIKKLKKLIKYSSKYDDVTFAENIQKILRDFLSGYFNEDFSSATTSDLPKFFARIYAEDVPLEIANLETIFARTDYIRFACGQVDSEFKPAERETLVDDLIFMISVENRTRHPFGEDL